MIPIFNPAMVARSPVSAAASSARRIVSAGTRRSFFANPTFESAQMIHIEDSSITGAGENSSCYKRLQTLWRVGASYCF